MKRISFLRLLSVAGLCLLAHPGLAAEAPAPLRVLLITGGCCHDYAKQKDILKEGLEARANVVVTQIHTDDKSTKPPLEILGNPDYAKGYDLVIHDECAADVKDAALVEGVLAPHRAGIPGVNLHCAMHSYRTAKDYQHPVAAGTADSLWFEYLGLQSGSHGPQLPIAISFTDKSHPITKSLSDWTTINEEHYNNIQIFPTATPLAHGKQTVKSSNGTEKENDFVVAWANDYKGTRVFSTTIGHNNATVGDARYLDLVTRGVLWATKKADKDGNPLPGYGPKAAR